MNLRLLLVFLLMAIHFGECFSQGNTFVKQYKMPGIDEPAGVLELEDGWLIAGRTTSNGIYSSPVARSGFMMKIGLKGKVIWKRFYGDTVNMDIFGSYNDIYAPANCLFKRKNGNVVVIGFTGYHGYGGVLAMECNPDNGEIVWIYRDSFPDNFISKGICEDSEENLYLLSTRLYFNRVAYPCVFKLNKTGIPLWKKHLSEYEESTTTSHITTNADDPLIVLTCTGEYRDSVFLLRFDKASGNIEESYMMQAKTYRPTSRSWVQQFFKIDKGYNLLIQQSNRRGYNLQLFLDTNLNIVSQKYISQHDSLINPFYGEGYFYIDSIDRTKRYFTNKEGKIKTLWREVSIDKPDTSITFTNQSSHGGAYFLGYLYTEWVDQWECYNRFDCRDIVFIKTDSMGWFDRGPKRANIGEILLFPNPVRGLIKANFSLEKTSTIEVDLYNMLGQLVMTVPSHEYNEGYQEMEIDISSLSSGIYTFIFKSEDINLTKQILID